MAKKKTNVANRKSNTASEAQSQAQANTELSSHQATDLTQDEAQYEPTRKEGSLNDGDANCLISIYTYPTEHFTSGNGSSQTAIIETLNHSSTLPTFQSWDYTTQKYQFTQNLDANGEYASVSAYLWDSHFLSASAWKTNQQDPLLRYTTSSFPVEKSRKMLWLCSTYTEARDRPNWARCWSTDGCQEGGEEPSQQEESVLHELV